MSPVRLNITEHKNASPALCDLCPRVCAADRSSPPYGYCGVPDTVYIARCAPHMWEEPPISGTRGSGTVFFVGCNLRCVFCQNRTISRHKGPIPGHPVTERELERAILSLADMGVHNINLVTPTHYTDVLARVLTRLKPRLSIPVVWNSGGYETVETLRRLEGLVDIYLPDFKYASPQKAAVYSAAPDYPSVATQALGEMFRQTGPVVFDGDGLLRRGLLVRHLILPGERADSMAVLRHLASLLPLPAIRVSLMRQYTPDFAQDAPQQNLHRRLTDFEYTSVLAEAERLGVLGYTQGKEAADKTFTPLFEGHGV